MLFTALLSFIAVCLCTHPFGIEDMIAMHRLSGAAVNSDKTLIAYSYSTFVETTGSNQYALYISKTSGESAEDEGKTRICYEISSFSDLIFHPNNPDILYFTAPAENSNHVSVNALYMYTHTDHKCTCISNLPVDITNIALSPDAKYIAFSAEVFEASDDMLTYNDSTFDNNRKEEATKDPLNFAAKYQAELDARKYTVFAFDKAPIRRWDTQVIPGKWIHPFVAEFTADTLESKHCVDVMKGTMGDSPIRPFNDASSAYTFSKDSKTFYFVTQPGKDANLHTNDSVYSIDIEEAVSTIGTTKKITSKNCTNHEGRDAHPRISPRDGNYLYTATSFEPESESDLIGIVRWNLNDGSYLKLTHALDRGIDSFEILEDTDEHLIIAANFLETGRTSLRRLTFNQNDLNKEYTDNMVPEKTVRGGSELIQRGGTVSQWFFIDSYNVITSVSSYIYPQNLMRSKKINLIHATADEEIMIFGHFTHFNDAILNDISPKLTANLVEEFWTPSQENDDYQIHSFFFPPNVEGFDPNDATTKYPVILYVHGGPESPWDDAWSYRWNPLVLSSRGYALVATNFHGSSSFGDKFTKSIRQHWFDYPVHDTLGALEYALRNYQYLDANRIGAMGASYGGTHINWLMGDKQAENIKCFISHDGIFNLESFGLETDETYFIDKEMGGSIFEKPEMFKKWNPMRQIANAHAPALIFQGGKDYRIQEYQSMALYQALLMNGVDAKLVYFPTQSHWVYKPLESRFWHAKVFEFLDKHLENKWVKE